MMDNKYEYIDGESGVERGQRIYDMDMSALSTSVKQTMTIDDLQIQLAKMQIQCLEERRNYLGLVGNNEQLKLENEDMKRKFQAALLLGKVEETGVIHFLQKNPQAPKLTDEIIKVREDLKKFNGGQVPQGLDNPIVLAKQVAQLQKYLQESKELYLVEIFGLKTSLELTLEERLLMKEQYEARLKEVVNKLEDTRNLMHKMTEENLRVKKQLILSEQQKQKEVKKLGERLAEVENGGEGGCVLFQEELDGGKRSSSAGKHSRHKCVPPLQAHLLEKLTRSEIAVMEQSNMIKEYELKFIQFERKLGRVKEEEAATKKACSEIIKKLKSKNESLEARFSKLDERRKLDNSGFRSDVALLRTMIKSIERKLHLFMTRKILAAEEKENQEENQKENYQRVSSPPERDLNLGRIKVFPESRPESSTNNKNIPDFDLRTMAPPLPAPERTTTIKGRGVKKSHPHPQNPVHHQHRAVDELDQQHQRKMEQEEEFNEEINEENKQLKEFDVEEERRDSREELEKDKLIYSLLCKVLDSAKYKVNQIERGVLAQIL